MKKWLFLPGLFLALALSACGPSGSSTKPSQVPVESTVITAPEGLESPSAAETIPAESSGADLPSAGARTARK